jgi:hypothetical protein
MGMPRDRDARKYYRVALQRIDEAMLIHSRLDLSSAAEYLGGYAVECILKALLISAIPPSRRPAAGDLTVDWLKREVGHDLPRLRQTLAEHGVMMPREIVRDFMFVSTWDPGLRYEPGPGDRDRTTRFLASAKTVIKWADRSI